MAKRGRKRSASGRFLKNASHRRRRHHKNAPMHHKRRRSHHATMRKNSHHRRRHRRNPDMIGRIGAASMRGAVGGLGIVTGQVLARKSRGGLQGVVTTSANVSTGLPGLATTAGFAVLGAAVHSMFTPSKFRSFGEWVVAGMFSEAINFGLALTPAAPYLSAFPPRNLRVVDTRRLGAYTRSGMGTFPVATGTRFGAYTRTVGVPVSAGSGMAGGG